MLESTYKLQVNPRSYLHFRTCIIELSGGFLNNYVDVKIFSFENDELCLNILIYRTYCNTIR